MRSKSKLVGQLLTPGPGTYMEPARTTHHRKRAETFMFGTEARHQKDDTNVPGPGAYRIPCTLTHMAAHTNARSKSHAYI